MHYGYEGTINVPFLDFRINIVYTVRCGGDSMYQTQIQSWGNSQAIRLPKALLKSAQLDLNEKVEIQVVDGNIVIKKSKPKTFRELIAGYEGTYDYEEWDTGEPVGKEVF